MADCVTECHGVGVGDALAIPARAKETPAQHHARIFRERERYRPSERAELATDLYRIAYGLSVPNFGPAGLRSKRACLGRAEATNA